MNQPLRLDMSRLSGVFDTGNSFANAFESVSRGVQCAYQLDLDPILIGFFMSVLRKHSTGLINWGLAESLSKGGYLIDILLLDIISRED